MKKVIAYECEICYMKYPTEELALKCESEGQEEPLVTIDQDILYEDEWNGGFGTSYDKTKVIAINDSGHKVIYEIGEWYEYSDGSLMPHPQYFVEGNDEFKEKCKLI